MVGSGSCMVGSGSGFQNMVETGSCFQYWSDPNPNPWLKKFLMALLDVKKTYNDSFPKTKILAREVVAEMRNELFFIVGIC